MSDELEGVHVESIEPVDEIPEGMHVVGGLGWVCIRCGQQVDNGKPCEVSDE